MTMQSRILPTLNFNIGTQTASSPIKDYMATVLKITKEAGLDISDLLQRATSSDQQAAKNIFQELHDTATVLYLHWRCCFQQKKIQETLATARLFNEITHSARQLDQAHNLVDKSHLDRLKSSIEHEFTKPHYDPATTAKSLDTAAIAHTHEKAWYWVVLPTFRRQPYGRILLFAVDIPEQGHVFVTQPFFLARQSTLFHTHGRNWAFARPLGQDKKNTQNLHLNSMWKPRSLDQPFPLILDELSEYTCRHVVAIPPRTIHGISRKRQDKIFIPALHDLIQEKDHYQDLLHNTRFGELGCMHLYCPDKSLSQKLAECPIMIDDEKFFIENDMIVFDHTTQSIWAGGGGSWARRMIEFGTTGEHCGICYEDDPRRENLDARIVTEWLTAQSCPKPIVY